MPEKPWRLTVPDWLHQRSLLLPNKTALVFRNGKWTFGELERQARMLARRLVHLSIQPGDRVALLMRNSPGFVALVHAIPRTGAVLVPLNTRLAIPELQSQVEEVEPAALVYDESFAEKAKALARAQPRLRVQSFERLSEGNETPLEEGAVPQIDLPVVHTVVYTSGTSGRPKGATLTFGNHFHSAIASALNLGLHTSDCWLACLPLFHVGGLAILFRGVIYGIPVVLEDGFDPTSVNDTIDRQEVTIVSVVANMLQRMLDERGSRPYPASLRCVLLGGGPAPLPLLEECARRGLPVVQTYGLTETASQIVTLAPDDALRKLGSAGKPLFGSEIRIEGEGGNQQPPGQPGEIVVRGPSVTAGYFRRPEETERRIREGWLYTGDAGYLDDEGYLYVLDRRDDLIISGGENVYPAEIEAVLLSHPGVIDAGVAGMTDPKWGQVPVALVVLAPETELPEEELIVFCRQRLAGYKTPKRVRVVPALPRNAAGKLLRRDLPRLLEA